MASAYDTIVYVKADSLKPCASTYLETYGCALRPNSQIWIKLEVDTKEEAEQYLANNPAFIVYPL